MRKRGSVRIDVGVRRLRAELRHWLEEARRGRRVVVTERGRPVAVLVPADADDAMVRLVAAGVVTPARRPKEAGSALTPVRARGPVADLVTRQRR